MIGNCWIFLITHFAMSGWGWSWWPHFQDGGGKSFDRGERDHREADSCCGQACAGGRSDLEHDHDGDYHEDHDYHKHRWGIQMLMITMMIMCCQDGSLEARIYAKMTLKLLMEHPDFDRVLKKNVTANTLRNLEKILDSVRNGGMSSASTRKRRLTSNGRATAPTNRGKTL